MKKDVLKKLALVLFTATLTVTHTPTIYSAIQIHEEERQFLDTITTNIDHFVVFSTQWMYNFLNQSNNESYNTHIDKFQHTIHKFNETVVKAIHNHKPITQPYGKVILLTKNIVNYLFNHANDVCNVFNRYRNGGTAIGLGLALQSVNKKYSSNNLQRNLQEAEKLLEQIDNTIAQKVKHTIAKAKQQDKNLGNRSMFDLLKSLQHRVNCKGPSLVTQTNKTKRVQSVSSITKKRLTPSQRKVIAARQERRLMIAKKRARRRNK